MLVVYFLVSFGQGTFASGCSLSISNQMLIQHSPTHTTAEMAGNHHTTPDRGALPSLQRIIGQLLHQEACLHAELFIHNTAARSLVVWCMTSTHTHTHTQNVLPQLRAPTWFIIGDRHLPQSSYPATLLRMHLFRHIATIGLPVCGTVCCYIMMAAGNLAMI